MIVQGGKALGGRNRNAIVHGQMSRTYKLEIIDPMYGIQMNEPVRSVLRKLAKIIV